ncbi:hypothetical protein N9C66_00105 [Akkermansiaceae bacterium]|nr:hypothetical protein [Akkermansiaceae bacterium]
MVTFSQYNANYLLFPPVKKITDYSRMESLTDLSHLPCTTKMVRHEIGSRFHRSVHTPARRNINERAATHQIRRNYFAVFKVFRYRQKVYRWFLIVNDDCMVINLQNNLLIRIDAHPPTHFQQPKT